MATTRTTWVWKVAAAAVVVAAASAGAVGAGAVGDPNGNPGPTPQAGMTSPSESVFVPITPCRIVNTQNGAPFQVGEIRTFRSQGNTSSQGGAASCGIPASASALEMTVTAVAAQGSGYLRVAPAGQPIPNATFLNYGAGQNIGNTGTVATLPGTGANVQIRAFQARTHVIIDVGGYYVKGLQASIGADGVAARANGLTSSTRESTGTYRVNFDRDIRGCAYSATIGNTGEGTAAMGDIVVAINNLDPRGVYVATRNADGTPVNRPFHVIVSC
jgi:hypothetical protein